MEKIIVFGAGGHAKAVIDVIEQENRYEIIGIIDSYKPVGTEFYGYTILGNESYIASRVDQIQSGIVAIGDNWRRSEIVSSIYSIHSQFTFVTTIHPSASIAKGSVLGQGSVVMAGAVVGSDTIIGQHCILYSKTSVDHDCTAGDYVTFAPNATTGGDVHIDSYSVVSLGANIIHGMRIGKHSIIGAGSTVLTNIDDYTVAYGTPARKVRSRQQGERYL